MRVQDEAVTKELDEMLQEALNEVVLKMVDETVVVMMSGVWKAMLFAGEEKELNLLKIMM
ncbi:hypothetical protein E2C01_052985 [Portunus trituberculatus]|uniref:Uncharacterized protein n=1 Tax=Portunus trituberculatus TaxID=210409 RepID=A0A5B7GFY4_PORTR|nr:hypothetical protein [Portunus trituberculatus]